MRTPSSRLNDFVFEKKYTLHQQTIDNNARSWQSLVLYQAGDVVELVDTPVLEAGPQGWEFKSLRPHQNV